MKNANKAKNAKKFLVIIAVLVMAIAMVACDNDKDDDDINKDQNQSNQTQSNNSASSTTFQGKTDNVGDGEIAIRQKGATEEASGNATLKPVSGENEIEIEITPTNVNAANETYIYVDGNLVEKEELDDPAGEDLDLEGQAITAGEHKIQFVQYENNDPTKAVTFYREAKYTVEG